MKTLYLLRHAKSSWQNPQLADFERPLNKRGHYDAPLMGNLLEKLNILPELIISSPAIRAAMTTRIIAEIIKYPLPNIRYDESIYTASESELLDLIKNVEQSIQKLMLVGHNPTFTHFSHFLAQHEINNLPTTGFMELKLKVDSWKDVRGQCGKLTKYEYPKKYK